MTARDMAPPTAETPNFNRNEDFVCETAPHLGDRGYFMDPVFEEARRSFRHYGLHRTRVRQSAPPPRYYGIGPANYVRSDAQIREDIRQRLERAPDLDASDIEVEVRAGSAILTGSVPEHAQRFLAEESIGDVIGTKRIENRLTVAGEE